MKPTFEELDPTETPQDDAPRHAEKAPHVGPEPGEEGHPSDLGRIAKEKSALVATAGSVQFGTSTHPTADLLP